MRLGAGAIFCMVVLLSIGAWASGPTFKVIYTFQGYPTDGSAPWDVGTLLRDAVGNIYGTTRDGGSIDCNGTTGGTLFELSSSGTETVLHDFGQGVPCGQDGLVPQGAVAMDSSGNLYGTTAGGGPGDCGAVWEWESSSSTLIDLATFNCSEGAGPVSGVVMDKSGNLYGTAVAGGSGNGIVYEVSSGVLSVLYTFTGGSDGGVPRSGLVMDSQGNLYGMTYTGGAHSDGTVFELSQSGGVWTEKVLHSFSSSTTDGSFPSYGNLTLAGSPLGNVIYGMTEYGGSVNGGTVFKMVKKTKGYAFTLLHSFTGSGGDGLNPYATLAPLKGKLYGTTGGGGTSGYGTVFELTPGSTGWTETILYNFTNGTDGSNPIAGLAADTKGNLYGTAIDGGSFAACSQGCGVVFKVHP
ncbi:MAG: choice-of-anchor tandem repeat GloVer-containing protein [Candidatus Sulfotelmatobacter sp.]